MYNTNTFSDELGPTCFCSLSFILKNTDMMKNKRKQTIWYIINLDVPDERPNKPANEDNTAYKQIV